MSDLYVKNLVSGTDFVISSWFRHQIKQRSSLGDFLDQVHTICHSTVYLPSYRLLAPLIIVVFYCNRFVTRFRVIVPTRVRDYVEQYKIYSNKVAQLRKVARKRFYEDRIRYTNDTNPKSGGTTSKCYLVFHSSQQSLASVLVNGSTILDKQLADVILDLDQVRGYWTMLLFCVQRYHPCERPTYFSYKRSRFVYDFLWAHNVWIRETQSDVCCDELANLKTKTTSRITLVRHLLDENVIHCGRRNSQRL